MRLARSDARPDGFTLVELLVSVAIVAGVLAAAYLCLNAGLGSQRAVEARLEVLQNARVALALLAADLRAACTLSEDFEFVGMDRTLETAEADNLDFATHNWRPEAPGEADFCEVSYFVDRSPETGELGLWRRRDPSPDGEPLSGGAREEIAPGLRGFRLEYYDGFEWYDEWGNVSGLPADQAPAARTGLNLYGLPEAVRVTVAFAPLGKPGRRSPGDAPSEPPVVLQEVVRLNLAGRSDSMASPASSVPEASRGPDSSAAGEPPPGKGG